MRIAVYKDSLSTGRGADRAVRNFAAGLADGIYALLTDDGLRASFENLFRPEDGERDKQAYVAGWEALLSG